MLSIGLITKIISNAYTVKVNNEFYTCSVRGKIKIKPLVGDKVKVDINTLTIEEILPRINFLDRPSVSNIDVALIVTSIKSPDINLTLLDKLISIITINKITPVIVLTKLDLCNKKDLKEIKKLSKYYDSIGIKVFNNKKINKLKRYLKNKIVVVTGQTGAGKSTIINKFDSKLNLETDEISISLGRGKHTTRIVELFQIDKFFIVDTPGFSSIDINNYTIEEIQNSFNEIKNIKCKYNDCKHLNEEGCNVINNSKILESRYNNYVKFIKELKNNS